MKFAIFGNTYQAKKSSHALRLFQLLRRQKAEVCMCRDFYQFLTAELKMDVHAMSESSHMNSIEKITGLIEDCVNKQ